MRLSVTMAGFLGLVLLAGPARAQSVPPETLEAARQMVAVAKATDQAKTLMPLLLQQLKPAVVQGRPEVERDHDAILPIVLEAVNGRLQEFAEATAMIYARHFTKEELQQVTAFYGTPVGQKFIQKMGSISQEAFVAGQAFGQSVAKDMEAKIVEELRKRGHKI